MQIGKANVILYISIILIFILALLLRILPSLRYITELRALDPFAQFKSTRYIIENGLPAFFQWQDYMSWAPNGVAQGYYLYLGTPFSGVFFYYFFQFLGINISIYDTCAAVPAIVGALCCIPMYFLGKELAGNKKTGLLAAFFLAICVGFQARTISGFFDNEPVGLFGMIVCFYGFIKSLKTGSIPYAVLSGIGLAILGGSWGAYTYVWDILPLTVLFLILLKKYSSRLLLTYSITFALGLLATVVQPKTAWDVILSGEAIINIGMLGLCLLIELYRRFKITAAYNYVKIHWKLILRVSLFGLLILLIITSITGSLQAFIGDFIGGDVIRLTGGRYFTVIFPFLASLTIQSVAEHMPSAWGLFYYDFEFLLFLFPLGLYFLFKRLYEEDILIILFGLTTVYFASSMSRVHIVFSVAICLIAAFGLASLIKPFSLVIRKKFMTVRRRKRTTSIVTREISVAIFSLMFFFLMFTSIHGTYNAAYIYAQPGMGNDFREAYAWMRSNLPSSTVIVAWWDYGYEMTTVGEITTVVDNGTWNTTAMGKVGRQFMATDELEAIQILGSSWDAEYVLVSWSYFYPNGGGDEGKWQWMIRIAYETLINSQYAIEIGSRWNETSYKPTCEFFDTMLWRMLTYGEVMIDYVGNEAIFEELYSKGYPLFYFLARMNWADPWKPGTYAQQGQWLDDSGHLWKEHNPAVGAGMLDDGFVQYDTDAEDDTVGQFANLQYFSPAFFSAGHLVKIFKIDYDKAKLRAEITDSSQLYNNSIAEVTINNNGQTNLDISSVSIDGKAVNFVPISGATSGLKPGQHCQIKAYGPNLPLGQITNGSSYTVDVSVSGGSTTYTATKKLIAEPSHFMNMTIAKSQIQALSNETILVPITNIGNDLLEIASVKLNNQDLSTFGTYYSSIGENQIDVYCNFTEMGFAPTNVTAKKGDLVNFHVSNLVPGTTIKFGMEKFDKETQINYGQTKILSIGATHNGTYPFYCFDILWPPDTYNVGNLTISAGIIQEHWNYKFIPVNETKILKISCSQQLTPNQFINLTISTNSNENISRSFRNLQVFSGTSCLTALDTRAFANESVYLSFKNTGAYNEIIDHLWLNGEIFDIYSTPNPHEFSLQRNTTANFRLTFPHNILNLNITSPYDPRPLQVNVTLQNSRIMDLESQHKPALQISNTFSLYNLTIKDEIFSNETVFLNITNKGSKAIEISDVWINNVSTTVFSVSGSPVINPSATKRFNVTSKLNLHYLDNAQLLVRTYEGPYSLITRKVGLSGKINITWSEAYQNNQTTFLKVTNLRGTPITVKSVSINYVPAASFKPISASFYPLPDSFKTVLGYGSQFFNVTMYYSQFTILNYSTPLKINLTTYEGVYTLHNATWAYAIKVNKAYAFTNNTVTVDVKNVGRYPVTIKDILLNSTSTYFTIINGSSTPLPNSITILKLTSTSPLLFGSKLVIKAVANFTNTLKTVSDTYQMPFVLYNGPNITIVKNWPNTVAFDNSTIIKNDTVYVTIMNTGNTAFTVMNFLLNNTLHRFGRIDNQTIMTFEPLQSATFVNRSLTININAKTGQFLAINVTTNIIVSGHNLSTLSLIRVFYNKANITIMDDPATSATRYVNFIEVRINFSNFGDRPLVINLQADVKINGTANWPYLTGSITLNPGESIVKYTTIDKITYPSLYSSSYLKISVQNAKLSTPASLIIAVHGIPP